MFLPLWLQDAGKDEAAGSHEKPCVGSDGEGMYVGMVMGMQKVMGMEVLVKMQVVMEMQIEMGMQVVMVMQHHYMEDDEAEWEDNYSQVLLRVR